MNINYEKIQQSINEYGQYILNSIKNQYSFSLTPKQLQNIDKLLNSTFIVIERPTKEDIEFFSKQAGIINSEDYSSEYIPSAHGGRTKDDNKIHIYPYTKSFSNCKSNEEIIQSCIDSIVIHEIFHYFIRPNLFNDNENIKDEFGHFLTEGLVQYYTEEFAKKYRLGNPKSNYGKNVAFVKQLIESFPNELTQAQIDRIIFTCNQEELLNIAKIGNEMYKEYVNEHRFKEDISKFIKVMLIDIGMNKDDEKLKGIINHYKKIDDINIIYNELSKIIELKFKNNREMGEGYMLKLRNLISNRKLQKNELGKTKWSDDIGKENALINTSDTMYEVKGRSL